VRNDSGGRANRGYVEQAFTGTIVLPSAKLSLSSQIVPYYGTFFARDIESHQDNVIVALPFGWEKDCVQFGCSAPDMRHPCATNLQTLTATDCRMP
jgi:hypothetical protein